MTCSPAKLAANRANAQKSTGPRTVEGKAVSRANALKHGLCASVVVAEDLSLIQARSVDWFYSLHPQNEFQAWMVDKIAVYSLRVDRAERMERRLRDRVSLKAELAWDDDRRVEAEALGRRLGSNPSEVAERLRRTPAGCDWMIRRWDLLAEAAEAHGGAWTPEQAALAFDLLGTPAEFRQAPAPGASPEALDHATLARGQAAELAEHRRTIADLDEVDRSLTCSDLFDESHPELKRLRRYEGTLHSRIRWCLAQLRYVSPHFKAHPDLTPSWEPAPAPSPAPGPRPRPGPPRPSRRRGWPDRPRGRRRPRSPPGRSG